MSDTLCTLFEGDYHLGAAALINSLHRGGFSGTVVCGYRGALPPWHTIPEANLAPVRVLWVEVSTKIHFTNYKPVFMIECLDKHTPNAEKIYYSDPDIVIKSPWRVLARWAADGIALCEDLNASLPARHPFRLAWLDFLESRSITPVRALERYYNAGFIGLPRAHREVLNNWQTMLEAAASHLGDLDSIKTGQSYDLFHTVDQDALNMALLLGDWPLNTTGPEGMDFMPGGNLLSHAAGKLKPWRRGFVKAALQGRSPGQAQKRFFDHVEGPIPVFSPSDLKSRRSSLNLAAMIGRFYHRSL